MSRGELQNSAGVRLPPGLEAWCCGGAPCGSTEFIHTRRTRRNSCSRLSRDDNIMAPKRRKKRKVKRRRTAAPRVQVPRVCDAALSALLAQGGESRTSLELTLGEAVKRLWAHAKANGLQDGREIRCDAAMRELFDTRRLGMFEVSGALSAHMRGSSVAASASSSSSSSSTAVARSAESARLVTLSPALTSLVGCCRHR